MVLFLTIGGVWFARTNDVGQGKDRGSGSSKQINSVNRKTEVALATQTNTEGGVTVSATPTILTKNDQIWEFKVTLDTHQGSLDADLTASAILRDQKGSLFRPLSFKGDPPGGHHREGVLQFTAISASTETVTLVLNNIGNIKERVFTWTVR